MADDRDKRAHLVIAGSTTAAMAAALVPVPVADVVAITTVQIGMLGALGAIYGMKLDGKVLLGLVMVHGGAQTGMWFGSLLKTVPVLGTVAGGAIEMTIAGTFTAAMGLGLKDLLRRGEPIDAEHLRRATDDAREEAAHLAADQREAARTKAARDAAVRERVGLAARSSDGGIDVTFRLGDEEGRSPLRVTEEDGTELCAASVAGGDSPHVFRSSAFQAGRTYVVALERDDTFVATTVRF